MNHLSTNLIGNDQVSPLTSEIYALIFRATEVLPSISTEDGSRHFKFGIMRRLYMIRLNVCEILRLIDRPTNCVLQTDDGLMVGMNLNSLYVHLHGILDNMAWCIAYEWKLFSDLSENEPHSRRNIGLFYKDYIKALNDVPTATFLESKKTWHSQMTQLRDPIAHRVPLYAVPGIMTPEEAKMFGDLNDASIIALKTGNLDEHQRLMAEAGKVGTYHPIFCNDIGGDVEFRHIRPNIDDDVRNILEILTYFLAALTDSAQYAGTSICSSMNPRR